MKRFHECAVVKDGNAYVGFFICDTGGTSVVGNPNLSPWTYVEKQEFERLVNLNQVQYFVPNTQGFKIEYTEEEVQEYKRKRVSEKFIEETKKNYFNMDCSFKFDHVYKSFNYPGVVASCIGEVTSILGAKVVLMYFVGSDNNLEILYHDIINSIPGIQNMVYRTSGVLRLILPVRLIKYLDSLTTKALFNTSTIQWYSNNKLKKPNVPLIQKSPSNDDMKQIIDYFNNLTEKNKSKI